MAEPSVLHDIIRQSLGGCATVLSQILQATITLGYDLVVDNTTSPDAVPALSGPQGTGISARFAGDLSGKLVLFLPEETSRYLAEILTGRDEEHKIMSEIAVSSLKETGNILVSSFVSSLEDGFSLHCLPALPNLYQAVSAESLLADCRRPGCSCAIVESPFSVCRDGRTIGGTIYLCATRAD